MQIAGLLEASLVRAAPSYKYSIPAHPGDGQVKRVRTGRPPAARFPRHGPEANTFRCDFRKPDKPYDLCRAYPRPEAGAIRWVNLRHGTNAFGFRHLQHRRGFSAKTDRYIAATVRAGVPNPDTGAIRWERNYSRAGKTCQFRVVDTGDPKGILTAYVIDGKKQGPVSLCP